MIGKRPVVLMGWFAFAAAAAACGRTEPHVHIVDRAGAADGLSEGLQS